jgi:flagellar protein FliS
MNQKQTELEYRKAAVRNASPIGLVVMLYDTLAGDLQRAIDAMGKHNIEARSAELKHALLVIQQLEDALNLENGGELARNLVHFYSILRAKILEAQIKCSTEILEQQITLILDLRQAWHQVDVLRIPTPEAGDAPALAAASAPLEAAKAVAGGWTA